MGHAPKRRAAQLLALLLSVLLFTLLVMPRKPPMAFKQEKCQEERGKLLSRNHGGRYYFVLLEPSTWNHARDSRNISLLLSAQELSDGSQMGCNSLPHYLFWKWLEILVMGLMPCSFLKDGNYTFMALLTAGWWFLFLFFWCTLLCTFLSTQNVYLGLR